MNYTDYVMLDQKVCMLSSAIETNLLAYINPVNIKIERKKFFSELNNGNEYNPKFTYASRNPFYSYFAMAPAFNIHKSELKELIKDIGHDSLGILFEKKIIDLFERMELIKSVGTANFAANSFEYYGELDNEVINLAKELVSKKVKNESKQTDFVSAKKKIDAFVKSKKLPYKVVLRKDAGSKFAVNIRTKEVLVNEGSFLTEESIERLIAHEIEAHAYRYENGAMQPYAVLARGLSKETIETEEGLAVLIEQKENINIDLQLKIYAGRVLAIKTAQKKSFFETFQELTTFFSDDEAFNLALRAKRGTFRTHEGGAFAKDLLYLKGKIIVENYVKDGGKLRDLFYGRYSVYDAPLVLDIAGLREPKYLPRCKLD